jgi:hypothetical protein
MWGILHAHTIHDTVVTNKMTSKLTDLRQIHVRILLKIFIVQSVGGGKDVSLIRLMRTLYMVCVERWNVVILQGVVVIVMI